MFYLIWLIAMGLTLVAINSLVVRMETASLFGENN